MNTTDGAPLTAEEIRNWLLEEDEARLETLWRMADATRHQHVGDQVHLRGLVEVSNYCVRACRYCGVNAERAEVTRYRMGRDEILACARRAAEMGFGTVVMQAGEDYGLSGTFIADVIREIKKIGDMAVTLSLGERPDADTLLWKEAGANRYLLRFETSDPELYRKIHPDRGGLVSDRIAHLRRLRAMGYEIGGGVMVGIPGQSVETLVNDILLFRELDLDMIGVGPYIPHPATPLADPERFPPLPGGRQVLATETMVCKVLSLARLMCPEANLPSTTALATINRESGRAHGLVRGANIVMPNLTPPQYRVLYEIYPAKAGIHETAEIGIEKIRKQLADLGRIPGMGHGSRQRR